MNRIAAARGAFNAFGSISCMLIVKHVWTCHMEFALYKLIIINYHQGSCTAPICISVLCDNTMKSSTFQIYETQGRVMITFPHDENVA